QNEVKANRDAFDLVAMTPVRNVAAEHGSYGSVPATASGPAPTRFAASWLAAVAADLSAAADSTPSTTVTSPATTPTTPTVRPSATT
ncbi:hypothetical protein NVV99_26595, partial [Rhodococcus sp. PAE-6]|nr:hypothetical protein [Rhodococcus sp. PAE-6]